MRVPVAEALPSVAEALPPSCGGSAQFLQKQSQLLVLGLKFDKSPPPLNPLWNDRWPWPTMVVVTFTFTKVTTPFGAIGASQSFQRWSHTIKNMVTNLSEDCHPFSKVWSPTNPRKACHHHQDGHPLSQGYGYTPSLWWSPTNGIMVTNDWRNGYYFPQHSHPSSPWLSSSLGVWLQRSQAREFSC